MKSTHANDLHPFVAARASRPSACALLALLAALLAALAAFPLPAAPPFDAIIAFGDSLTDTGNEPADSPLHYEGRWSNGPLWVEHLSARFGLAYEPSNNVARSGAQCDDTYRQVTNFVPRAGLNLDRTLFVVWAGGNDFLQEYDHLWFDDAGWSEFLHASVAHLSNAVVHLHGLGARTVLVPNTVDVTEIPTLNYLPGFLREYLRDQVNLFNRRLSNAMARAEANLPGLQLHQADVYRQMKNLLRQGRTYGFTEVNIDALADARLLDKSFDGPGAAYLFWDPIHPTTRGHAIIADTFHSIVAPQNPALGLARTAGPPWTITAQSLHVTRAYTLEAARPDAPGPLVWTPHLGFLATASNAVVTITNPPPAPALFRLRWTPP